MLNLARKALPVLLIVLVAYGLSFLAGIIVGLSRSGYMVEDYVGRLSGAPNDLELAMPVIGDILKGLDVRSVIAPENAASHNGFWELVMTIFTANFLVAGAVIAIRSLLVLPLAFNLAGAFHAGISISASILLVESVPGALMLFLISFIVLLETLFFVPVVVGALATECWVICPAPFGFPKRRSALVDGLRLLVLAVLFVGVVSLPHAVLEAATLFWLK